MFVDEGILLEVPVAVALERLTAQLQIGGLQAAGSAAFNEGQAVLLRAGFAGLTKQVAVQNLPGYFRGDTAVIPIRWTATGPAGDLFPALDANLELDPAEAGTTRLTVHGSYRPPLGRFGAALDQLVLHKRRPSYDPDPAVPPGRRHPRTTVSTRQARPHPRIGKPGGPLGNPDPQALDS
jgi:hypothetical protein